MNKRKFLGALLGGVILLSGCYNYEDSADINDLDLVATNYQKDYNFNAKKTFALPDSVVLISGEGFDGTNEYAKQSYAKPMLDAIRFNMTKYGWKEELVDSLADVIILPSVSQTTNVYYYYSYSYWNWYYPGGYYPGGWGWYYPGYYYPPTTSSYKTGSMFIQMTDPSNAANSDQLPVVWTGLINGLAEGSTASIQARIKTTVDQAFTQSSYLNHNK
jgi:hypothetical protein